MKKRVLNIIIALMVSAIVFAQAPNSFKYQAVVRDASSNIMSNQNVSFKLSVYKTSATGTVVYSETHNLTTNGYGLANMNVGGGTVVSGSFSTIDWGNDTYFIKTEIDPAGGSSYSTMGTSQLQSVPYALNAKSVSGMNIDDLADVSTSGATTNQILSWNGSSWVPITSTGGTVYSAGSGITLSGTTFSNAAPDQTVTLAQSGATTVSGTYPNFTISSTDNNTTYGAGTGLGLSGTTFSAQTTSALWNANQIQGRNVATTAPAANQVLGWNGSQWTPQTVTGGGSSLWTLSGSDIYRNTGKVAIGGLPTSSYLFDVKGVLSSSRSTLASISATGGTGMTSNITTARFSIDGESTLDNTAVSGTASGTTGYNVGVRGGAYEGQNQRTNYGVYGFTAFNCVGAYNRAVFGWAKGTGNGLAYSANAGVYGQASDNSKNYGLYGVGSGTGSTNYGVFGAAQQGSVNYAGYFSGNVTITGVLTNPSDRRLKKDIVPLESALDKLSSLKIYTYQYAARGKYKNLNLAKGKQFGFMAQELEQVFPSLVQENQVHDVIVLNDDGTEKTLEGGAEFKTVNHIGMVPILTKAIQEQQDMIKAQQLLIEKQNQLIENLDNRIVELEK